MVKLLVLGKMHFESYLKERLRNLVFSQILTLD